MPRSTFLRAFLASPQTVGSVTPSSRHLSAACVAAAHIPRGGRVVELGAGTGPITEVLVREHGGDQLVVFEPNSLLTPALRERFPGLNVIEEPAGPELAERVAREGLDAVDAVVSGLPWTLWSGEIQDAILEGITSALTPEGRFVTYTYVHGPFTPNGRAFRARLERWFADVHVEQIVWCNVPPAMVVVGAKPRAKG